MADKMGCGFNNLAEYIGLERNGIVSAVMYENWNGASIVCHMFGWRLSREYLHSIFYYPFVYLKVKKIIAPVACSNEKSRRFVEKLGFRIESQLLDAHPDGSLLIYTMNKEQCRFIGERYGKAFSTAAA